MEKKFDAYGHFMDEKGNVEDESGKTWSRGDSWYRIGLFELICLYEESKGEVPKFCLYGPNKPNDHCIENKCKHLSCCGVPLTVASTDERGYADTMINFPEGSYYEKGTDPNIDKKLEDWQEDCLNTILDLDKRHNILG